MVKALHAAGLEVILDVVYNHTAEGAEDGPTLAFRGLDNGAYYRLRDGGRRYEDYTGCGNTLDLSHPHVLQLVMDSLRYWVLEMHVDGFRFDLAAALARSMHDVDMLGGFLTTIGQDPVLSRVKLIAEPWDVGQGGYQVGEFPPLWSEWNDKYRDTVRDFWRGAGGGVRDLGYRLSGSSDLYGDDGRRPFASVNFVTAHDGFTLRDLVSYDRKHNEANGEGNRDGTDDNRSWNHGVEGETDDAAVLADRRRSLRNLLTTLLLADRRADARGRRRDGPDPGRQQQRLLPGRRDVLGGLGPRSRGSTSCSTGPARCWRCGARTRSSGTGTSWRDGRRTPGGLKDLAWFRTDGTELTDADWFSSELTTVGMCLSGDGLRARTRTGERRRDDTFLLLLHGGGDAVQVTLPDGPWAQAWAVVLDTRDGRPLETLAPQLPAGSTVELSARSAVLLRATPAPGW